MNMKHAIVVGASSGLGRGVVLALQKAGYGVSGLARRRSVEADAWFAADALEDGSVERAISGAVGASGPPRALVYSAGLPAMGRTLDVPRDVARRAFEVNLWGFDAAVRAVLPVMLQRGTGTIVYVSSIAGLRPLIYEAYYAASKAAAVRLASCLDRETRARGVRVKSLHVGFVDTGFFERGGWHGMEAPPVSGSGITASDVGREVLRLIERDPAGERLLGWRENVIALSDRLAPGLYDRWVRLRAKQGIG